MNSIKIHPNDNVMVALKSITLGDDLTSDLKAEEDIKYGHKAALIEIKKGQPIIKYGNPIGEAKSDIKPGQWVHTHNMKTAISEHDEYVYNPNFNELQKNETQTFNGYLRPTSEAAVRNEVWILPLVGCVNSVAMKMAEMSSPSGTVEGIYAFTHPYGCSQMGDDHVRTRKLLASLAKHPNAGGVLVLGLGCENLTIQQFKDELGDYDSERIRFLVCQQVEDEFAEAEKLIKELCDYAGKSRRQTIPASKLVIGMKCGGSDGLSGITANPTVGRFSDLLISQGGSTVLTEVPEMFGAENLLMNRCESKEVFDKMTDMINGFKDYYVARGQVVYENPSPGNKEGGISTLEDKSCGCIQKGGTAKISDVIEYAQRVKTQGLTLLSGPGNDLVSATALTAAGAHIVLFTTGRGTPFGAPAPTVKISTNTELFNRKPGWMDFNAGTVADGEDIDEAGKRLLDYVLEVAGGEKTSTEKSGYREIAIFKDGVTL